MKVKLSHGISALSGKKDSVVYCYNKESGSVYSRDYVKPDESVANVKFADIQRNLWKIRPSEEYKNDLRQYIEVFNKTHPRRLQSYHKWNNLYIVILYEMQRLMPGKVNLATLTREQIYEHNMPCRSIAAAVQGNLILPVAGWEEMTSQL